VFRRLASRLRVDALKLHRLLALVPDDNPREEREARPPRDRRVPGPAPRAAAAHVPPRGVDPGVQPRQRRFPRRRARNGVHAADRRSAGAAQARLPDELSKIGDFALAEPTDYPDGTDEGYDAIRRMFIDPIEQAQALSLRVGTAIANHFGAHG
jgi:phosphoenolpyruvate carboxylase